MNDVLSAPAVNEDSILHPRLLLPLLREVMGPRAREVYVVGGAVRDLVMGKQPEDFDLMVSGDFSAALESLKQAVQQLNHRGMIILREEYRPKILLYTVYLRDPSRENYSKLDFASISSEFGALRLSEKEQSFRPGSIEYDLSRRDFTINAMALPLERPELEHLIQPYSSIEDINKKLIRALTSSLFERDPESILRSFYYRERLGFTFTSETESNLRLAITNRKLEGRARTSRRPLIKIFSKSLGLKILPLLIEQGIMEQLFPEFRVDSSYFERLKKTYKHIASGELPNFGTETEFMFGFSVLFPPDSDAGFLSSLEQLKMGENLVKSFIKSRTLLKKSGIL